MSEENLRAKQKLHPLFEFIDGFRDEETLQLFLNILKNAKSVSLPPDEGVFVKIDFPPEQSERIEAFAKKKGITWQEAIDQLIDEGFQALEKGYSTS
jgi:hypothetical protein